MKIKKKIETAIMKIMLKIVPVFQHWPLKIFAPTITKVVNWYIQKRFAAPKAKS